MDGHQTHQGGFGLRTSSKQPDQSELSQPPGHPAIYDESMRSCLNDAVSIADEATQRNEVPKLRRLRLWVYY